MALNVTLTTTEPGGATAPAQMSAPALTVVSSSEISVDRAAAPDDGGSAITSYDLRYSTDEATWTTVNDIADPESVTGLSASTLYYFQTRAVNAVGAGNWSVSASDTTDAPAAGAPDQPADAHWSMTDATNGAFDLTLSTLVANADAYEYTTDNEATWRALPEYAGTGTYRINVESDGTTGTDAGSYNVKIRALDDGLASIASNSDSVTVTNVTSAAQTVTSLFVGDQQSDGSISSAYSVTGDTSVDWVLTTSYVRPTHTQVSAGQDHTGSAAAASGTASWVASGGDVNLTIPNGLAQDAYYLHVLPSGGSQGDVYASNGFNLETVLPTYVSATTNTDGDRLIITFSETLAGTVSTSDFAVTDNSGAVSVVAAKLENDTVALNLGALIPAGDTVTIEYTGSGVTDTVSNALATFGPTSTNVTNAVATYSETAVTVPNGTYLVAPELLPSDTRSIMLIGSFQQDDTARSSFISFLGTQVRWYSDFGGGGFQGVSGDMEDTVGNSQNIAGENVTDNNRINAAVSCWIDGANTLHVLAYTQDVTGAGSWTEAANATTASDSAAFLKVAEEFVTLFANSSDQSHQFSGTVWRNAGWASSANAAIEDISDPAVLADIGDTSGTVNPGLMRIRAGTPYWDFHGAASRWSDGIHSGSMTAFTRNGSAFS